MAFFYGTQNGDGQIHGVLQEQFGIALMQMGHSKCFLGVKV
jgi:hypothetical protein